MQIYGSYSHRTMELACPATSTNWACIHKHQIKNELLHLYMLTFMLAIYTKTHYYIDEHMCDVSAPLATPGSSVQDC
jgi:hypothetical protein